MPADAPALKVANTKASGAEVIGVTLQLYDYGAATGRKGACCAGQDIRDARAVADKLGIPHYVLDYEKAGYLCFSVCVIPMVGGIPYARYSH